MLTTIPNATVPVAGTFALVSFDATAYCQQPVWLHAAGQAWFEGVRIGRLGILGRHGYFATMEGPGSAAARTFYPGRTDAQTAALQMVNRHMQTAG